MELDRFIKAQERDYNTALSEIKSGKKRSHWMWYIFPQIQGLGLTDISRHYAIRDIYEAAEYLQNKILGTRLVNICKALLELQTNDALEVFGNPDYLKLKSCMTLFEAVPLADPVFAMVLDKYYQGNRDERTLSIIANQKA
jgi:uncharacterized protein (DUF1810 family)